uniref:Protein kinase domain-containing protein n=1 Tax=Corethron hystrix TaxID=216773 RepID=A0A7S1FQV0_9STRA|mmetsp:Transcript_20529/g.46582  ORF Transcript_20529/g.46582 Transcript_20529/m.46582 type:complete len:399 (+) Transcript_20529:286-1482(+)|eukprot:CAMPEP_0113299100 /NCGR_PEP_ID=MMETSP0010_2-20120614/1272_1 /TAXON_ID=216773 ORGANISM="Corethron hystrix, Strain 308" /NCGR_SAMPLE_ID=MMETSP0010_2 /ASSEMBLY_ACC=CAM_ASM_000155 /LENGTH=398 /DNA_ID=CAMNT_0000152271 /DNA_START=133 /DNA_END=1329 /DNA_ORIENTATION=+ /assembly_acc=CAM_ASM_000155
MNQNQHWVPPPSNPNNPNTDATYQDLVNNGPPDQPLDFDEPLVYRSILITALVVTNLNEPPRSCDRVLIREDVDEEEEDAEAFLLVAVLKRAIFGEVRKAIVLRRRAGAAENEAGWIVTKEFRAVKIMDWDRIHEMRGRHSEDPIKEVSAMQYLTNRAEAAAGGRPSNLLPITDIYTDDSHLYMIMPFADGGELFGFIERRGVFPEEEARYWFRQILDGLHFLQGSGVCHRDISLENLIVTGDRVLIMDFGMCLRVASPAEEQNTALRRLMARQGTCGKINYMAPEIYRNKAFDGFSIDLWCTGVVLFMMLTGTQPWERPCDDIAFRYIAANKSRLQEVLDTWHLTLSPEAVDLISGMLKEDPRRRLTLQQVMEHEWVTSNNIAPPQPEGEDVLDMLE